MNLSKKKNLAAKALKVGKGRVKILEERMSEVKDALTKQDIKDLVKDGAIEVKEVKGRKKIEKRKRKRGAGKIKKKVNKRKENYVIMTRKLRAYTRSMYIQGKVSKQEKEDIRKKIRNKFFKSKANLKQYIEGLRK